jgi:hypothetical protein
MLSRPTITTCFGALLAPVFVVVFVFVPALRVYAVGDSTAVEIRILDHGGPSAERPTAAQRLAWEVRQRTSVETKLEPSHVRLSDPTLFDSPLLYMSGDRAFPPWSIADVQSLRRYVDFGGTVIIDDAAPEQPGFDASVRRELGRAFGAGKLTQLPASHVVYRSFYLVPRPVGRVEGPDYLEVVEQNGRAAVIYSRHDLGGAYERDNVGNYKLQVTPGHEVQREMAFRLGVNLVLYALCLDYKDDQVHAPFIMRRGAGRH